MPTLTTYPGVYIEEISSGVHTITGVATSITAFLGRTEMGPPNEPLIINSFGDFERQFGGIGFDYPLSYAVRDFYLNGGSQAIIVRLETGSAPAGASDVNLVAASPGTWGNALVYVVDSKGITDEVADRFGIPTGDLFNLTIYNNPSSGVVEKFRNVAVTSDAGSRRLDRVLLDESNLVQVKLNADGTPDLPAKPGDSPADEDPSDPAADSTKFKFFTGGLDSGDLDDTTILGDQASKTGLWALEKADLFNLLCIPADKRDGDTSANVYQNAMAYCVGRRAMLLVDPPAAWGADPATAVQTIIGGSGLSSLGLTGNNARNAALYFPRVVEVDPELDGQLDTFVPCGLVAGIMARTDTQRGVWKTPAGLDASVNGTAALEVNLTDAENGILNPLGVNCLRTFAAAGRVVWGGRTLRGADQLADEYKYIAVRRTALFLEESLYRGTQWVVFEPNDEPLWAQIRLNVGAFMQGLFRQGAFQGATPKDAYLVKCDSETTTQADINSGVVNILVGFAPLKPAEFVIIKIQQLAGQLGS